jgi:hypothetical protein
MNKAYTSYVLAILSVFFFTALTLTAIVTHEITIFYVVYVFWWDEVIKTVFDLIRFVVHKNQISDLRIYKLNVFGRIYMLSIYLVFIIVCFGMLIEWSVQDLLFKNVEVLLFKNIFFNMSLILFIGREGYVFANKRKSNIEARNIFSKGIITLHLSIILGVLFWAIASNKIGNYLPDNLKQYSYIAAVTPFILIKLLFDWLELKEKGDGLNKVE